MMRRSCLLQRMKKPLGEINPFSFGGGGSGFPSEIQDHLKNICSWDYMGASEYEFGTPAKALNRMITDKTELVIGAMKLPFHFLRFAWSGKPQKYFDGEGKVFYICPKKETAEVQLRIKKWANNYQHGDTRDPVYLDKALAGEGDYCGWFDIDNDFMFFTDEKMWISMCEFFDIKVPSN